MKKLIDMLNAHPFIEWVARLCLGCVFVYASIHKIVDPATFAKIIYGYGLVPGILINGIAIVLPYVELFAGLFLILGIFPRSAAVLAESMLLMFIIAISINLIRGHEFDCGCFSFQAGNHGSGNVELLLRDVAWSIIGMAVIMYSSRRKFCLVE